MRSDSEETGDSGVGRMHDADAARRRARKTITMKPDVPKLPDILARVLRPSYRPVVKETTTSSPAFTPSNDGLESLLTRRSVGKLTPADRRRIDSMEKKDTKSTEAAARRRQMGEAETSSPPTSAQKVLAAMSSKSREAADLRASRKKAKESKPYDPHTDQGDWKGEPVEEVETSSPPTPEDKKKTSQEKEIQRYNRTADLWKKRKDRWDKWKRETSKESSSPSIKAESSSPSIKRVLSMRRSFTSFITALSEARGSSPAFTRRHFQMVADVIKVHPHPEERKKLADHHATIFAGNNPRFDKAKFYAASGVTGWQPKNVPSKPVAEAILDWKKFAPGANAKNAADEWTPAAARRDQKREDERRQKMKEKEAAKDVRLTPVDEAETSSPPISAQKVLAAMGSKSREAADLRARRKKAKESKPYDPHTDQGDWKSEPGEEAGD